MRYILSLITITALTGCASLNFGWYKPGISQQEYAQDKYDCMSKSQMEASGAYVNAYGGAASSGTTTNMPLFQACMQAHGYAWTNQAAVEQYEASQRPAPAYSAPSTYHPPVSHNEKQTQQKRDLVNRCLDKIPLGTSAEQIRADRERCTAEVEASLRPKSKQDLVAQCLDKIPLATNAEQSTADWNRCNAEAEAITKH